MPHLRKTLPACFDVIIVGAGHAGNEAALACATVGLATLLVTGNVDHIGHTSCNPSIGGIAKGHMVHEIDALGGAMGRWADEAALQARILNASKGPAVQSTRVQIDRHHYMRIVQGDIFAHPNIHVTQAMVTDILTRQGRVAGVRTRFGQTFHSRAVLITAGTFMQGRVHIGDLNYSAGRFGDAASLSLSDSLRGIGFTTTRFMTCTPPRLLADSIDFSLMDVQHGDTPAPRFSSRGQGSTLPQIPCHLTYSTAATHEIIHKNVHHSAIYNGNIPGTGPRYCPSIEDKIVRYPDKERHQIFIEPEGATSPEIYPNALFTALPADVQRDLLHTIPGLEHCHMVRPGYAIEYDIVPPTQLLPTLETKPLPGLYCAGQINGSSGYEEAAAQGLWAALNIHAALCGLAPFLPGRDKSYIAVLVDDLVTKGTEEPYRMFTSRAEYRLLLRENTAATRLTPLGREYGLVQDPQWQNFSQHLTLLQTLTHELTSRRVTPDATLKDFCAKYNESTPVNALCLGDLLKRPNITCDNLAELMPELTHYPTAVKDEAETFFRYEGYVARQEEMAKKQAQADNTPIPSHFDYSTVAGLTSEAKEKLAEIRPMTIGQARRISGISPAAITAIEIHRVKMLREV